MTESHLAEQVPFALRACAWLGSGMLIGAFHLLTLRWSVRTLTLGRATLAALVVQAARFALLAGLLAGIVRHSGSLPLVLTAAGVVAARTIVVVSVRAPT